MVFLIKNLFLKARKLIFKLEKVSTQDFNFCSVDSVSNKMECRGHTRTIIKLSLMTVNTHKKCIKEIVFF